MGLPRASGKRMSDQSIAFGPPGGERCGSAHARPIDLEHLARQTFGDRALEGEVLALFSRQAAAIGARMATASPEERSILAHTLKGSARSIGAFRVAEQAERIEAAPSDAGVLEALSAALSEVRLFIAAICR